MKPTATATNRKRLRLAAETLRNLVDAPSGKQYPAATTLSTCAGGCKADSRLCSL